MELKIGDVINRKIEIVKVKKGNATVIKIDNKYYVLDMKNRG